LLIHVHCARHHPEHGEMAPTDGCHQVLPGDRLMALASGCSRPTPARPTAPCSPPALRAIASLHLDPTAKVVPSAVSRIAAGLTRRRGRGPEISDDPRGPTGALSDYRGQGRASRVWCAVHTVVGSSARVRRADVHAGAAST